MWLRLSMYCGYVSRCSVFIQLGFSGMPGWLDDARELLKYRRLRMKTGKELEEEALELREYQSNMAQREHVLGQTKVPQGGASQGRASQAETNSPESGAATKWMNPLSEL
eukprot:SAG11_NODE_6063_length_1396_cov_1.292213_2_plen_110_part_00